MAYTMSELSKSARSRVDGEVLNTLKTKSLLLEFIPWEYFEGTDYRYVQEQSLPTSAAYAETDTWSDSTGTTQQLVVAIKEYGTQWSVSERSGSLGINTLARTLKSHARSLGETLRNDIINGVTTSASVGATLVTNGISACTPGPRLATGTILLDWAKDDDELKAKFPGDDDYGAVITTISGQSSAVRTVYGDNTSKWAALTIVGTTLGDVADFTSSAAADSITLTSSNTAEGLKSLAKPSQTWFGNMSQSAGSTNGDAVSLEALDLMIDESFGERRVFVGNPRTIRSIRQLIGAYARPSDWVMREFGGMEVASYRGFPLIPCEDVELDETIGSTTTATSVYMVNLDVDEGFHGVWSRGSTQTGVVDLPDDSTEASSVPSPVTVVNVGAADNANAQRYRMFSLMTFALKNDQALVRLRGITD